MLAALIESWGRMALPVDTTVGLLIVENDDAALCEDQVKNHPQLPNGATVAYVHEPELGIPFGRNRAAREAIAGGADLLVFVDDDETVDPQWLVRLIQGYRDSAAVLLGAPLRIGPPVAGLTRTERMMHDNITEFYRRKEDRAAKLASLNDTPRVTVVTNNWIAETRLFSEAGIWFDETMRFTGGTDSKFYEEVKRAGYPVGWVRDAYVYETWPKERLSFRYHHGRARDQINNHFHRKMRDKPVSRYGLVLRLPGKLLEAIILAAAVPLTRGRTLLKLAKTTGWISGRVGAAFGVKSKLYTKVTGE